MHDFLPPTTAPSLLDNNLFNSAVQLVVQTPAQSHETKKESGSSDGAKTYDTIRR